MSIRNVRLAAGLVLLPLACLLVATAASGGVSQSAPAGQKLGKHDRQLILEAKMAGESTVTLLLASQEGQNAAAISALQAAGAKIQFQDDEVSYITASIPVDNANVVESIDAIQSADVDEVVPLPDPSPDASQPAQPQPAPGAGTPKDNPYMPIGETKAAAFLAAHPTWDGRNDHDRDRRHRHRPPPPEPPEDEHGRTQDRAVDRRHASGDRQRSDVAPEHDRRQREERHVHCRRRDVHGADEPRALLLERAERGRLPLHGERVRKRPEPRRQPGRLEPPLRRHPRRREDLGRQGSGQELQGRDGDAGVRQEVRRPVPGHGQPGHAGA